MRWFRLLKLIWLLPYGMYYGARIYLDLILMEIELEICDGYGNRRKK